MLERYPHRGEETLVASIAAVLALTTLLLSLMRMISGKVALSFLVLATAGVAFFAIAVLARVFSIVSPLAVPFVGTVTLGAICVVDGGLWSDATPWLPFVPLVAVVLGVHRGATIFSTAVAVILVALLGMHRSGMLLTPHDHSDVLHFGSLMGAAVFGTYLARRYADVYLRKTERLRTQAHRDTLTGLLNRRGLEAALVAQDSAVGVLYIDLDGLKGVNDAFGHDIGDTVIAETASRIKKSMRDSDVCARVGGDEFVILLPELASRAAAERCAERLLTELRERMVLSPSVNATLKASVGVAYRPAGDATRLEGLVAAADTAMYRAKRSGGDRFVTASPEATLAA